MEKNLQEEHVLAKPQEYPLEGTKEYHQCLMAFSEIIKKEHQSLHPNLQNLAEDLYKRVARLWYQYFSKGIYLATGGVDHSFVNLEQAEQQYNLLSEDIDPNSLDEQIVKQFLLEEHFFSTASLFSFLKISFSMGSHEGIVRIARALFNETDNNTIFFPSCCYGLLVLALTTMKPYSFRALFVDVDRKRGEKISLDHLQSLIKQYPSAKTLLLELKTICGATYTEDELRQLITVCKKNQITLIADTTHINMSFSQRWGFPDISRICLESNFHSFFAAYTASKTYGLERARIGFIVASHKQSEFIWSGIHSASNLPLVGGFNLSRLIAKILMASPVAARQLFLRKAAQKHYYNMNLMLGYIEGVGSEKIDPELRATIAKEIPPKYQYGIDGLYIVYIPESGIHMKVDTSGLHQRYLANIRMFNSEIFSYALNIFSKIVSLHSYCIMDPDGFGMRLSFSIKEDVQTGMQGIHNFVCLLRSSPHKNPYFLDVKLADDLIFSKSNKNGREYRRQIMLYAHKHLFLYQSNKRLPSSTREFNKMRTVIAKL